MIDGLALDYAGTRALARLAWRPSERLWQRLHSARGLRALLDAARTEPLGNYLSGLAPDAGCGAIDLAFRAQWRARVAELAGWAPQRWRAAIQWCSHLVDASAVAHLWAQPPLPWMQDDPVLIQYAPPAVGVAARRALLVAGPLAQLGRALQAQAAPAAAESGPAPRRIHTTDPPLLPAVLVAWTEHWQSLWPPASPAFGPGQRRALHELADLALAHRRRFAQLPPADTEAAREALAARVLALLRADAVRPVALFAYLVVLALDLERLRAECLTQAFDAAAVARERTGAA